MAYEIPGFSLTFPAGEDFRPATNKGQFRFVALNSSGQVVMPSANGATVGVRQIRPQSGEACTVVNSGVSIVEAGGAITAGGIVATDAAGKAVAATGASTIVVGVALETSSGDGIQIAVLLVSNHVASAT